MAKKEDKKLSYEEFFKIAILKLRDASKSRGIHYVFSGFNQAFREYFREDPVKVTTELASQGKIVIRPVKGGVMLYLPGDAPQPRTDLGKKALSIILNEPSEHNKGLVEKVLGEVAPDGIKKFPEDFLEEFVEGEKMHKIVVPGTPLQLDLNSQTIVISPKRYFRYEAKNPSEAKYIIYAHRIGQFEIKIPRDNRTIFKAVTNYEKYCREKKHQCFTLFLKYTNDEDIAELLTKEVGQKLDLKANKN